MNDAFPTFRRWGEGIAKGGRSLVSRLDPAHGRLITVGWRQWSAVILLFAGLVTVLNFMLPDNSLRVWYWTRVVAPSQEARYGFRFQPGHCGLEVTSVEPQGAFDRAGVKPGWIVFQQSCWGMSSTEVLIQQLRDEDHPETWVTFRTDGCKRDFGASMRRVQIEVPRTAA
jgi:hypothetical protein